MYCEVILSQRFPKHLGIFDYKIPEYLVSQIKIGQLVTIPFRKSEREGIVIKIKRTGIPGKKIKEISKINQPEPIITPKQIQLAEWMAQYYFVSLGTIIKMMLPPIPKKKSIKKQLLPSPFPQPTLPLSLNDLIYKLVKDKQQKFLFWPQIPEQQAQFLYWLIKRIKGTILIIVPEIMDINYFVRLLPENIQKKTAIIHSQLNKNQFYNTYSDIIQNKKEIIIGAKLALFSPIQKLQLIILDQEENQNHKQSDQNPRFDARLVAEKLASLHKSQLLFTSHAPTVNTYYQLSKKRIQLLQPKNKPKKITIIDLKEERKKRNYSVFSDLLEEKTNQVLKQSKKIFFFINKRGAASSVVCQDCGYIINCPNCQLPLIYHTTSNAPRTTSFLYCHRCNKKSELPPFCPKCSGVTLKFTGLGTQKVESEAKKLWPKAKIFRLDKDIKLTTKLSDYDIMVGTERAFDYLDWQKIGLTGVITADTFLHLPDFRSTERTWQMLSKISYLSQSPLIIQTYTQGNPAIKYINSENFYKSELSERKAVGYPPFANLVKLIYQNKDKKTCFTEAQRLYKKLKTFPLSVSLVTPLTPFQYNKWQMYIVIKYSSPSQDNIVNKILTAIPPDWIIDRDPENLL